jgi:hypothetical protein
VWLRIIIGGIKMYCRLCGKESHEKRECKNCTYFLNNGADEETLKKMYSDDRTKRIWKENRDISVKLAMHYYRHLLEEYDQNEIKKDTKENFGFNTFTDGIRCGLDIVLPLLDDEMLMITKKRVKDMLNARKNGSKH